MSTEIKEEKYLFEYYRNKIHPVLLSVKDTVHIHSADDIHKLRVNLKKIKTLFALFEIVAPKKFKADKSYTLFEEIFEQAGKIREAQMNRICIDTYKLPESSVVLYHKFLERKEKKAKKQFSSLITDLKDKKIIELDAEIEKLCSKTSTESILNHSQNFIFRKIKNSKNIPEHPDNKTLHKVRKNLKSVSAISTLLHAIEADAELEVAQESIKKAEDMIGDWHDTIVLESSLHTFLKHKKYEANDSLKPLINVLTKLQHQNKLEARNITTEIKTILQDIK